MKLLFGTSNKGKVIEVSSYLSDLPLEIVMPADMGITDSPEETGTTFEENARLKAQFYHDRTGLPTLADDSGITIEALQGELGLHTRRWGAGANATDQEWIEFFLDRMKREPNKNAKFECSYAYIDPEGTLHIAHGKVEGTITETVEAEYLPGLPMSSVFKPHGYDRVFSNLTVEEKNLISHRGRAISELRRHFGNQ